MSTIPSPETPAEDTPEARLAYRKALRKTMVERRHGEDLGRQLIGQPAQTLKNAPQSALSFRRRHSSSRGVRPS